MYVYIVAVKMFGEIKLHVHGVVCHTIHCLVRIKLYLVKTGLVSQSCLSLLHHQGNKLIMRGAL